MKALFRAARTALALSMMAAILPAGPAAAEDSLVIWSPTKVSPYSYRLRTGARAPAGNPVSAGVDFSLTASSTGQIRNTRDNARLWAEMRGQGRSGAERSVVAGYNPVTGRVSANAGVTHRWMASRSVDVVLAPSLSADTPMRRGGRGSVRVTQKAQVQALATGTAFVASGTAVSGERGIGAEMSVEQRLFRCLDLTASVRRQEAGLTGALKARLRVTW